MIRRLLLLLSVLLLGPAAHAADEDSAASDQHIEAGKALLEHGDVDAAQQEFFRAAETNSGNSMAFFYQAITFYRQGDLEEASSRLRYATHDPANKDFARIEELRAAIKLKLDFARRLRAADEAYAKGLTAKAADTYAEAFALDPTQGETGLKAAALYADRLNRPLDAAVLWQKVVANGEPHATAARAELQSHRDMLEPLLQEVFANRQHWRLNVRDAEAERLAEAFPDSLELQVELAVIAALRGQRGPLLRHLQAANQLGLTPRDFLSHPEFTDHFVRIANGWPKLLPEFSDFVRDAYGEATVATLQTELKRRNEQTARIAREKAEKEQAAKLKKEITKLAAWHNGKRATLVQAVQRIVGASAGVEVDLVPGAEAQKTAKKKLPRWTVTRDCAFSLAGGRYVLATTEVSRLYKKVPIETGIETSYSFPSFAGLADVKFQPSRWADPRSPNLQGADLRPAPAFQARCNTVTLLFARRPSGIKVQEVTVDFATGTRTTSWSEDNLMHVQFDVMLAEADFARLKHLLERLAKLDSPGPDLDKLRQVHANWVD